MKMLKMIFELFKETAVNFGRDKGSLLAAALAYYTIFSLAPLLVIAVAVAGFVFGEAAAQGQLVSPIEGAVGKEMAVIIQGLIKNASQGPTGIVATIVSGVVVVMGASGVFTQLKAALNLIWGIQPAPDGGILVVIRSRFWAIVMVMGIGFLLLVSVAISLALTALTGPLTESWPFLKNILPVTDFIVIFAIITLLFATIFKALPDARISWRDVGVGAAVTAFLFGIGEYLVGLYLGISSVGSAYGATSSLVVLLFWIYISAQIFMFGAEFTQVYANKCGSGIVPTGNAVMIRREAV